jgi:hypothetical protein
MLLDFSALSLECVYDLLNTRQRLLFTVRGLRDLASTPGGGHAFARPE